MSCWLEIRDLTVRYGDVTAVAGADLVAREGELLCLLGASGCGKTTLLRAVAGFEVPERGAVRIAGETVAGPGRWVEPERRRVGMVFQEGALFPHMTVRENVGFGLAGTNGRHDGRIERLLERVGLAKLAERFPDQLSGGQRQRAALARALAPEPRLILLDEPFAGLDASRRVRLRGEMREVLRRAGATTVLVTHDQEEAFSVGDTVAVMQGGRILQCASPEKVYSAPASIEVARFVGQAQLVECTVRGARVETPLGPLATDAPDGPARLLLRPESLALHPATAPGIPVEVRRVAYFGHDALYEATLADGTRLQVRRFGPAAAEGAARLGFSQPGERCRLFAAGEAYWATTPA